MGQKKKQQPCKHRGGTMQEYMRRDQRDRYGDPEYLPETPWGDLAHLSDQRNTGAARQDLYEVWRCPLSTR